MGKSYVDPLRAGIKSVTGYHFPNFVNETTSAFAPTRNWGNGNLSPI